MSTPVDPYTCGAVQICEFHSKKKCVPPCAWVVDTGTCTACQTLTSSTTCLNYKCTWDKEGDGGKGCCTAPK